MSAPYYGMFTKSGNLKVDAIVRTAKNLGSKWSEVEYDLYILSKSKKFAEASDTAVRDEVYIALMESNGYSLCGRVL